MTEAAPPKAQKRIKYASAGEERIPYFPGTGIARPGSRGPWAEDEDNPMSATFRSPEERTERQKARWWALNGKKNARPTHGEYDARPAVA